ncbi:MAG: RluA family pseudouridine synthase [Flavobacteriaceae bacterium]
MSSTSIQVLYEDNHLIAVNKVGGLLVQGDKTGDPTLIDLVKAYLVNAYNKPGEAFLGVIHRIDRPTSGIVLFAKTSKALTRMNAVFSERQVKKTYHALVEGHVSSPIQTLTHYLLRKPALNKSFAYQKEVENSKKASLSFTVLKQFDRYTYLSIELHTGRHHQIRAQLAALGHPIKGDLKYGAKRSNTNGKIDLVAQSLRFEHPVKKETVHIELQEMNLSIALK